LDDAELLLIPGPVTVSREVLDALARPVRAHYGDEWTALYRKVTAAVARIMRTSGDVFLVFGPGSAGMEMALASTLAEGDEVLVPGKGFFAERIVEICRTIGLEVHRVMQDGYRPVDPEAVEKELRAHPQIRAVAVVHHETDLGLLNPAQEVAAVARQHGALSVLDAISSLGGVELDMDGWGIDLCVAVGNKVLGGPVGVAPVAAGPRAWKAVDDGRAKVAGWYLNLKTWRSYVERMGDWHPHPTTMPTNVMVALETAVEQFLAEGQEARMRRQAAAARRVREGLRELGFEMLVDDDAASPVCTAVLARPGMDVRDYMTWLLHERGLHISGGLGPLAGRIFRIGHMGAGADPAVVDSYLRATADYVELRRA
jgi:alanine-glyoxylate transaminase/serine-glyoxylate transaminase/serine-pyruvate transaminase